jgi:signal transduction histidine kinase
MSLRLKMFLTVVAIMTLVSSLLTLNLWVEAYRRSREDRRRTGEFLARLVQDWLGDEGSRVAQPEDPASWVGLSRRIGGSVLFEDWSVFTIDEAGNGVWRAGSSGGPRRAGEDVRRAAAAGQVVVTGNRVAAPLVLAGERRAFAVLSMSLPRRTPSPAFAVDSFRTVVWVMALGTLLLILNVYIFLNGLVLRPLEDLAEASRRVARGDFARPVREPARYDEIAELIRTFNGMMKELHAARLSMEGKVAEAGRRVRETEQQLVIAQRLTATGTLAAGIAHEINNPLAGMLNAARALRRRDLPPGKAEAYLDLVIDGLQRIQETVRKVLQFSPRAVDLRPFAIAGAVEKAAALAAHRAQKAGARIATEIPPGLPPVLGDEREIQQVVLNLLLNAIDAVAPGPGDVTVTADAAGGLVSVRVRDTGCGMSPEEVQRSFDLFYTTKEAGAGAGLGLSIAHVIVRNHGGTIQIASEKGRGTTVTFTLPAHG